MFVRLLASASIISVRTRKRPPVLRPNPPVKTHCARYLFTVLLLSRVGFIVIFSAILTGVYRRVSVGSGRRVPRRTTRGRCSRRRLENPSGCQRRGGKCIFNEPLTSASISIVNTFVLCNLFALTLERKLHFSTCFKQA